jgi:glycopeptide antibiotics resistance protein
MKPSEVGDRAAAATRSGTRLARAVLGYYLAVVAVIVLVPFEFVTPDRLEWVWVIDMQDFFANILLFVPFGFLYRLANRHLATAGATGVPAEGALAVGALAAGALAAGALASGAIEVIQMWAPHRYASPIDILANTLGAGIGALLYGYVARRLKAPALVGRLSLELPLMGLLYLLIPLLWIASLAIGDNVVRLVMLVLPVVFGATLLGMIQRHHFGPARAVSAGGAAAAAAAGVLLGTFPALATSPTAVLALAGVAALVVLRHGLAAASPIERRFELPALRGALPFFILYVAAVALVPLTDPSTPPGFVANGAAAFRTVGILRLLHAGALFTVVGYIFAEFRGRLERPFGATAVRLPVVSLTAAVLVLAAGSVSPLPVAWTAASAATWLFFGMASAHYGAWLYHLQRDHVRALVELALVELACVDLARVERQDHSASRLRNRSQVAYVSLTGGHASHSHRREQVEPVCDLFSDGVHTREDATRRNDTTLSCAVARCSAPAVGVSPGVGRSEE